MYKLIDPSASVPCKAIVIGVSSGVVASRFWAVGKLFGPTTTCTVPSALAAP